MPVGLADVLRRAQELGFLGPGPVEPHIDHAGRFIRAVGVRRRPVPRQALDLGAGGGLPGLVLALHWTASRWTFLDASDRRTAFLAEAVTELDLADRVTVVRARAEEAGRDPELRGHFDLVTARSFGPPAVTAECASPFLSVGGILVVSEPPGSAESSEPSERWDGAGVAILGLELGPPAPGCQVLIQQTPCPDRYPRRTGIPRKRPLF